MVAQERLLLRIELAFKFEPFFRGKSNETLHHCELGLLSLNDFIGFLSVEAVFLRKLRLHLP